MKIASMTLALAVVCCSASPAPASDGLQSVAIVDPTLNNMTAFAFSIPTRWHFAGTLYQAGGCVPYPAGVYKATSPDGLSFMESMPPLGWVSGSGPRVKLLMANPGCLPMKAGASAQEFLKFLAATLKVHYVGAVPIPAETLARYQEQFRRANVASAARYASGHLTPPKLTLELAEATVSSRNGSFIIKGDLKTRVTCSETSDAGSRSMLGMASTAPSTVDQCTAYVNYLAAPEERFDEVNREWSAPGIGGKGGDPTWFAAYLRRSNEQSEQMIEAGNAAAAQRYAASAQQFSQLQARAQQFQHDQDVRQQMHNQFLATMQAGTNASMANAQAGMDARSTAASDMVDYSLDQRTVLDPDTGRVSKVASGYNHTWIDSTGKRSYQTDYTGANPNGVLPGQWTEQQNVHGNGSP